MIFMILLYIRTWCNDKVILNPNYILNSELAQLHSLLICGASEAFNQTILPSHGTRNQLTLLIIGDNGQKLWRTAIDLYMILNFEGV